MVVLQLFLVGLHFLSLALGRTLSLERRSRSLIRFAFAKLVLALDLETYAVLHGRPRRWPRDGALGRREGGGAPAYHLVPLPPPLSRARGAKAGRAGTIGRLVSRTGTRALIGAPTLLR